MSAFITEEGLAQLKNYKYHSGKYTILDNALNEYWEAMVKLMPMWIAPNLITFIGWLLIIFSYTNMLRYDFTASKDIPNYCFTLAAVCIWTYSTLDAIDGKQARRTKSSSPLGQLFDHGCDSFATAFFILGVGQALKFEGDQTLILFVASQVAFWWATWTQYNTGVLRTNVGQLGVTQAHVVVVLVHLLTGFFGQTIWEVQLTDFLPQNFISSINSSFLLQVLSLKLGGLIAYGFGCLTLTLSLFGSVRTILWSSNKLKAISQCFTVVLIIAFELIWVNFSFYDKYRGLVLLNFGLTGSLIMCKTIIASVTKMKLQYFHYETLPLIIGTVLMLICELFKMKKLEPTIFWGIFLVNTITILWFVYGVINQITSFLGINCFSIKKSQPQKSQ